MTDGDGDTSLDQAIKMSTDPWFDQDVRKRCTEVVDYLKFLPAVYSESLLHHTIIMLA